MANPHVFEVGAVEGIDGIPVHVGVDYGAVVIRSGGATLNRDQQETLFQMLARAVRLAGRNEGDGT